MKRTPLLAILLLLSCAVSAQTITVYFGDANDLGNKGMAYYANLFDSTIRGKSVRFGGDFDKLLFIMRGVALFKPGGASPKYTLAMKNGQVVVYIGNSHQVKYTIRGNMVYEGSTGHIAYNLREVKVDNDPGVAICANDSARALYTMVGGGAQMFQYLLITIAAVDAG